MDRNHVLLIDDQPEMRRMLREVLEPAGYRVSEARDANAAYETARSDPPDLVICDLKMPGAWGDEIIARLRSDPNFKARVVVLSSLTDPKHIQAAKDAGADLCLTKPIPWDRLKAHVAEQLKKED